MQRLYRTMLNAQLLENWENLKVVNYHHCCLSCFGLLVFRRGLLLLRTRVHFGEIWLFQHSCLWQKHTLCIFLSWFVRTRKSSPSKGLSQLRTESGILINLPTLKLSTDTVEKMRQNKRIFFIPAGSDRTVGPSQ